MAKITIGDKEYTVPPLNFIALERAWPYIEQSMVTAHPIMGPAAAVAVIAAGLMETENFDVSQYGWTPPEPENGMTDIEVMQLSFKPDEDQIHQIVIRFLKKKLLSSQVPNLTICLDDITKEAGLVSAEGEAQLTAETLSPSPETAADTSPSS